jgi:hypothetical protein
VAVICFLLRNRGGKGFGGSTQLHDADGEQSTNQMTHSDMDSEESVAHEDDGVELATTKPQGKSDEFEEEYGEQDTQENQELV